MKFSIQTHLTHINTILEYCHASVIIDNADILYLKDWNVQSGSEKNPQLCFFLKKPFLVKYGCQRVFCYKVTPTKSCINVNSYETLFFDINS